MDDMVESQVRSKGDLAGVFEHDGETAYFYLYDNRTGHTRVLDAIHVFSGDADFRASDVSVLWDAAELRVGLLIRNELWAVFDIPARSKSGGGYAPGKKPSMAPYTAAEFRRSS